MVVVMLLMTYVRPSVVFAATTTIEHTDYDFSYKDWISLKDNKDYKEMIEKYGVEKYENDLTEEAIDAVRKRIFSYENVEDSEKAKELAKNLLENSPEGVMINATLEIGTNWLGSAVCKFKIKAVFPYGY